MLILTSILAVSITAMGWWCKNLLSKVAILERENEAIQKETAIYRNEVDSVRRLVDDDDIADILRNKADSARKLESNRKQ